LEGTIRAVLCCATSRVRLVSEFLFYVLQVRERVCTGVEVDCSIGTQQQYCWGC
jgi:hypothetical protein